MEYGEGSQKKKKKNYTMRFRDVDINFDAKYEGHQYCSKTLSVHILRVFGELASKVYMSQPGPISPIYGGTCFWHSTS